MNSRQRGASFLLALLLAGRVLDAFDLPWEQSAEPQQRGGLDSTVPAPARPFETVPPPPLPAAAALETAETAPTPQAPLRLNEAGERQLQALPGVGPVLAGRIVAFREEHGAFADMAALRRVKGIGVRLAERLAPLLRFD